MKKFLTALTTALLIVVMAFALSGCSKGESIKKAYENADYKVAAVTVKDSSEAKAALKLIGLSDDQVKEAENWEVITASKGLNNALILKFPSSGDLKDFLTVEKDGSKDTAMYDKMKEADRINGDCLLLVGLIGDAKDIFKNA